MYKTFNHNKVGALKAKTYDVDINGVIRRVMKITVKFCSITLNFDNILQD